MDAMKVATAIARRMRSGNGPGAIELLEAFRAETLNAAADRAVAWLQDEGLVAVIDYVECTPSFDALRAAIMEEPK